MNTTQQNQPQALDLEEAILGVLLMYNCISDTSTLINEESFYSDKHRVVYGVMLSMFTESKPIDILTVTQELRKKGILDKIGGALYISQLTNKISTPANLQFNCAIVQQKYMQREIIKILSKGAYNAYKEDTDVFDLLEGIEKSLYKLSVGNIKQDLTPTSKLLLPVIKEIEAAGRNPSHVSGVASGIKSLDEITGGWQKSDLIILAARPSMGKTAAALTFGSNAAYTLNKKVAFFSLEMSSNNLLKRLISSEAEINSYLLRNGKLSQDEWRQLTARTNRIATSNLYIDDTPSLSITELKAKSRRFKEQHGCELIIIDYLQLMVGGIKDRQNREQEISFISRSLKALAKDLEVPVIALSQLSRSVEQRGGDKRPQLSDLRESGAIEQDADLVIFPHRPEYYGITHDANGNSTAGFAELIVAKQRNGALGSAHMRYIGEYTKFIDWNSQSTPLKPNEDF